MDNLDTQEWLLTNGLGSFASGTVCDAHTRTYHGWLVAALDPPGHRTLLLSRINATLATNGQSFDLETNYWISGDISPQGYRWLDSFQRDPVPTWRWGGFGWSLTRSLLLPYGLLNPDQIDGGPIQPSGQRLLPPLRHRIYVHYRYEGSHAAWLTLRPLMGDRSFHQQQRATEEQQFSQIVSPQSALFQAIRSQWSGTPWHLRWSHGVYQPEGLWYWGYQYPRETERGLGDREDLYSPGYLTVELNPGDALTLEATVGWPDQDEPPLTHQQFESALEAEIARLAQGQPLAGLPAGTVKPFSQPDAISPLSQADLRQALLRAGDQFIAYRTTVQKPTILAGYPWFIDWGRDILISLPGLTLTTRRFSLARSLLETFAYYCDHGLIPNAFPDVGDQPFYNSLDASLWWIETLGLYLEATQDWNFLVEQYPTVQRIYKALTAGTLYNIRVDAVDGLLTWDAPNVALTWMDTIVDGQPVTPRRGKAIEINALWYSSLCWAQQWAERLQQDAPDQSGSLASQSRRYAQQAEQVRGSLKKYWNPQRGYFFDTIRPDDTPDASIRPNAVIALSLAHCCFPQRQSQQALKLAGDRLLTPYGLRSLDPADPCYIGQYGGDAHHRDRAYHQGTVWSWLLGPFVRAWRRFFPDEPIPFDPYPLLDHFQHHACIGSISEVFDGDPPHAPGGAVAQAWSVAELLRHWSDLVG